MFRRDASRAAPVNENDVASAGRQEWPRTGARRTFDSGGAARPAREGRRKREPECTRLRARRPTLAEARATGASWLVRLRGFRANASAKSHAELDNSSTLDIGDPDDLAGRTAAMQREFDFKVVGGCCGTDARHIAAIARATSASVGTRPREAI
jgi:hypothetical protein